MNIHRDAPSTGLLDWFAKHASAFESSNPMVPLSECEKEFVSRLVRTVDVIGLGEMTHGARESVQSRYRLLRHLVIEHGVTGIVLETELSLTLKLNDFVLTGEGEPEDALSATGSFLAANLETMEFVVWLREHNSLQKDIARKVQIFGFDMQSLDGIRDLLSRILNESDRLAHTMPLQCAQILARLKTLPNDERLSRDIEHLFEELAKAIPDANRVAELQCNQSRLADSAMPVIEEVTAMLDQIKPELTANATGKERFLFDRCSRSLQKCIDFYKFVDVGVLRDRCMAENILALREFLPGQKLAMLAANLHVSRCPIQFAGYGEYVTTGSIVAHELGDRYCVIGSAFFAGSYLGVAGNTTDESVVVDAHIPGDGTLEFLLHTFATESATPDFILDLQTIRSHAEILPWPETLRMNLGEAAPKQSYEATFVCQCPHRQYDAILFVTITTPITVLPGFYQYWQRTRHG